jgi:hypothetical protein
MSRRYVVSAQRGGSRKPVLSVKYDNPEDALNSFVAALAGAGHGDAAVAKHMRALTTVLLQGARGMAVLDPDLQGSVEISAIVTR